MKEFFGSKWFIAGMVGVMGILWLRSINKVSQAQANYDAVNARAAQAAADAAATAQAAGEVYDRANEGFDEAQAILDRAKELLRQG
jgi:multidrug resistance efflux pump